LLAQQIAHNAILKVSNRHAQSGVVWQPAPENHSQIMAYDLAVNSDVMEIGFGGQAGGGKSETMLGLAGKVFDKSYIFRSEYTQMDGLIDRGNEIYPESFVEGRKRGWTFSNRVIRLRGLRDGDWKKHQGQPKDFIAFDEAAEMSRKEVRSVTGWSRALPGKRTLVFYGFNPPTTPEGQWIVEMFAPWIDPGYHGVKAKSGEIRWFVHATDSAGKEQIIEVPDGGQYTHTGGQTYMPISRTFISSSRHNNPYLGDEYERRLDALPEPLRTLVKTGDMTLGVKDDEWQVIPTAWVVAAQARWKPERPIGALRAVGVDVAHGGADKTAVARIYGTYFDLTAYAGIETPRGEDVAMRVHELMEGEDAPVGVDAIGYGASAAERIRDDYKKFTLYINASKSTKSRDKSFTFGFRNVRAEMYWRFREALDPESGEEIALPPDRDLRVELCAPRYRIIAGNYIIEEKDEIKKRLNRSPDLADTIVMAWLVAILTATKSEVIF